MTLQASVLEQGVSVIQSVASSYITSDGAEIPRAEKVALQFVVIGVSDQAHTLQIIKNVFNKNPGYCDAIVSIEIFTPNFTIRINNPEMNAFGISKGGEVTKLTVSCEITAGNIDDIVNWDA
jgi:hypothetical protein